MKSLESQELIALLKAAKARSNRDWAMLLVAYRHGMRASEVTALKLSDVDVKSQSLTFQRVKGSLRSTQTIERLQGQPLLDERAALRLWLSERDDDSDYFFTSQKGGKLSENGFWRLFKVIQAEAGLEGRSCHALKHTRASLMIQGGANLAEVRQMLGHKSLSSTLRYIHATDAQATKAGRRAEANLF
jgi:type 1 fimbriae regulatory protein FimB